MRDVRTETFGILLTMGCVMAVGFSIFDLPRTAAGSWGVACFCWGVIIGRNGRVV